MFMEDFDKAKFLKSCRCGFISTIKIILPAFGGILTPYEGFLDTEGVEVESKQNELI